LLYIHTHKVGLNFYCWTVATAGLLDTKILQIMRSINSA